MNIVEIIKKKRDAGELSTDEMKFIIDGYVNGSIPEYQISAFLMATYFRGMTKEESAEFTRLMLHSGDIIDLSAIPGFKVDKHSTGGVGDKISLPLAPIVAACGVPVPMISGRGLGHTGGTLDKLESIPGFKTSLSVAEYKKVISLIGLVMIGQTKEIAPADKKMYALRDVTATVECIPLIAGSIMSKKMAEGIDALVLDIKTGRGAFMQSYERSVELARTLVDIGTSFGKHTIGFITDMNQPLGFAIGNWIEIKESLDCLRGTGPKDIMELTYVLGGAMVMLGGKAVSIAEGMEQCKTVVENGSAYQKFISLVEHQGGDTSILMDVDRYPRSKSTTSVTAIGNGYITSIDSLELGLTAVSLGAGRIGVTDTIDPKAGILLKKKVGDSVSMGEDIAEFYTDRVEGVELAHSRITHSFKIDPEKPKPSPLVISIVDKDGVKPFII